MTEALKYLKKEGLEESVIKDDVDLTTWLEDLMQSYADEQVKKALEDVYEVGSEASDIAYELGKRKALEEVEKALPSDEEIEEFVESYIESKGMKGHDLSMSNEVIGYGGAEYIIELWRNKTQEVINQLKCNHDKTTIAHGPDADKCTKCDLTWDV